MNIEHSTEDDAAIEQRVRANVDTAFHSVGTCKMALVEQQLGVVDKNLNVHSVQRLKVANLSIAQENVSGITTS